MTMPNVPTSVRTIELPPPGYPMLSRMISHALFPEPPSYDRKTFEAAVNAHDIATATRILNDAVVHAVSEARREPEPLTWIVGSPHPLIPGMKVVRMFLDGGGVDIYSVSDDGRAGMRNFIPEGWFRITEEVMPLDVFVDQLREAEGEDDEPEPEPEPAPAPGPVLVPAPPNGQSVS